MINNYNRWNIENKNKKRKNQFVSSFLATPVNFTFDYTIDLLDSFPIPFLGSFIFIELKQIHMSKKIVVLYLN